MVETVKNVLKRAVPQKVHSKVSMNRLKILVTTVNRSKADFYMDYIQSFGANMQFVFYGHGTAPREIMAALGLADSERAVIISTGRKIQDDCERQGHCLYDSDVKRYWQVGI